MKDARLPKGMINRIGVPNSTHGAEVTNWNSIVQSVASDEPDFGITISPDINGNAGSVDVNIKVLNDIGGDFNLVLCLTEDSIINWQKDGQIEVEDYEHNHVLRTVISDESLSTNQSFVVGEIIEKSYKNNINRRNFFF